MAMFDNVWYVKVFSPLVKLAVKRKINPRTPDRFLSWCKKDYPEMRWFWYDNQSAWEEMVEECLQM